MAPSFRIYKQKNKKRQLNFIFQTTKSKSALISSHAIDAQEHASAVNNETSCRDVRALCNHGQLQEALRVLQMTAHPDASAYSCILQCFVHEKALPDSKVVHAHMIQAGFNPDISLCNKLVNMYAKCGCLLEARRALDEMPERNVVSWTSMIAAYSKHGYSEKALRLFYEMQQTGIQPDQFAFATVLPACANLGALRDGRGIHQDIMGRGLQSNVFVGCALIDMYVKCGSVEDARQVFDRMSERNMVSWTAMISGYAHNGLLDEALNLFEKMPRRDMVAWNVMVTGYARNGLVDEALELFEKIPEPNVPSWNAVLAGFAQHGYVSEALKFFQAMPRQDVISWTTLIAGYAQNGYSEEALKLFRQMQLTGVKPNSVTFACVLSACANLAVFQQGKEVHGHIIRKGFVSYVFVTNAIVDMYAKCGNIFFARRVFDKMPERDVVSWTSIIIGYALHGQGKDALQLFEHLEHTGMKPDHVTFIGVLSACCHAGLVDDGWHYFNHMSKYYHIKPVVKHYCCMVDLLGRAGHLDEARDFINEMPVKPNLAVWGSLLAACRIHNNIELGKCVAEQLFELEPTKSAHYVLLSNIYAASGRWDDREKVRELMRERSVKMRPGISWIVLKNQVYSFLVGDRSHPQTDEIYATLDILCEEMKEEGYVPNTNFVLHDVEEEQKQDILFHHSEKLAIVFGLINTAPHSPIHIFKNLRVCGDCHLAATFISKIRKREIVMRDSNRFHHFKDGQCSCGDYW